MIKDAHIKETFFKTLMSYSKEINKNQQLSYRENLTKAIENDFNYMVNMGVINIFDDSYDLLFESYRENRELISLMLTLNTNDPQEKENIINFIREQETTYSQGSFNFKNSINSLFFNSEKSLNELIENTKPCQLSIVLNTYVEKNNYDEETVKSFIDQGLKYCYENNKEDKINFFLAAGANNPEIKKELFIKAVKEKDVARLNIMWQPDYYYIDVSSLTDVKSIYDNAPIQIFANEKEFFNIEENKDAIFKRFIRNNNFSQKNNKYQPLPDWAELMYSPKKEPKVIFDEIVVKKEEKPKSAFDILKNMPKPELTQEKKRVIKQKTEPEDIVFLNLINEKVSAKDLQNKWDKKLINAFYGNRVPMPIIEKEFLQENNITNALMKKNKVKLLRQPVSEFQWSRDVVVFMCHYLEPLASILFEETKDSIADKEDAILNKIKKRKITTSKFSSFQYPSKDVEEIRQTAKEYKTSVLERIFAREYKENSKASNWKKMK